MAVKSGPLLFTSMLLIVGCSPYKYKISDTKNHIIWESYGKYEEVHLEYYVICNTINRRFRNEFVELRYDSVLNILSLAFEKSGIDIVRRDRRNLCDSSFHFNSQLKLKKIDIDKIISISIPDSTLKLFPVVYINNRSIRNSFITSHGIPEGGYFMRDTFLSIAIYLIRNDEIVYLKSGWFGPVSSETSTYNEELPKKLEQEHWDKLVRLIMNDYIKRREL